MRNINFWNILNTISFIYVGVKYTFFPELASEWFVRAVGVMILLYAVNYILEILKK